MNLGTFPGFKITNEIPSICLSNNMKSESPPQISYLYSNDRQQYKFSDPEIDQFSYIPAIKIQEKSVIFTINEKRVIYYDDSFFYSLPEFLKKIQLPQSLDQDLLDKIAIIANYLARGEECEYEKGTAQKEDEHLHFYVKIGMNCCQVNLPCFIEDETIEYRIIASKKNESKSTLTTCESYGFSRSTSDSTNEITTRSISDELGLNGIDIDSFDKYF